MMKKNLKKLYKYRYTLRAGKEMLKVDEMHEMEHLAEEAKKCFKNVADDLDRVTLCKRYLGGKPWKMVAFEMGYSTPDSVRKRCCRALAKVS